MSEGMAFVLFPELEAHKTVLDQAQLVMNLMTQIQAVPRQHEAIAVSCDAHINILQESVSVISDSVREHLDAIQQLTKVRTSMITMAREFMVFRRTIAHEQAPLQAVATPIIEDDSPLPSLHSPSWEDTQLDDDSPLPSLPAPATWTRRQRSRSRESRAR